MKTINPKTKKPTHKAPTHKSGPIQKSSNPLVGKFFHSLNSSGKIHWQGCIIGSPEPGWYLVLTYSWLDGCPTEEHLVKLESMHDWLFYRTDKDMQYSYDYGSARAGGPYRDAAPTPTAPEAN